MCYYHGVFSLTFNYEYIYESTYFVSLFVRI